MTQVFTYTDLSPKSQLAYNYLVEQGLSTAAIHDIVTEIQGYVGFLEGGAGE